MQSKSVFGEASPGTWEEHREEHLLREVYKRFQTVELHGRPRIIIGNRHPLRTAVKASTLGAILGLKNLDEYKVGASLHDIGKWHEDVLSLMQILQGKKYSEEQRMIVRNSHTRLGPAMVDLVSQEIGFGDLPIDRELVKELCLYHHPEIDVDRAKRRLEVKILAIADKYDAMRSGDDDERSHRKPMTSEKAIEKLVELAELTLLDSELVQIFIKECEAGRIN